MSIRIFLTLVVSLAVASATVGGEFKSGIEWAEPETVTPGEKPSDPPSDAIILFGGDDMSAWEGGDKWKVEDGVATASKRGIRTKQKFGDVQLHLEWAAPEEVKGSGQGRGNSGVFLMSKYEIQILDSYDNETYFDGQAGAVYKQSPPMVNAMKKPGEWNTYDIIFNKPKRDENGDIIEPARITVLHNGVLIQNSYPLRGSTKWNVPPSYEKHGDKEPIELQFHGNPVKFRNIWVREIEPVEPTFVPEDTKMKRYVADWRTEKMTAAAPSESSADATDDTKQNGEKEKPESEENKPEKNESKEEKNKSKSDKPAKEANTDEPQEGEKRKKEQKEGKPE